MYIRLPAPIAVGLSLVLMAGCGGHSSRPGASASAASTASTSGGGQVAPTPLPTSGSTAPLGTWARAGVELRLGISAKPPLGGDPDSTLRRARDLDAIAALGVRVLRTDFLWDQIEPAQGSFDFSGYDRLVDEAAARGIEVLAILCYGTPWATGWGFLNDTLFPPDDPADFGAFVGETVAHFRGRVARFEIWNEQNIGPRFWKPVADPLAYGALLGEAFAAAKAANPHAVVAFGGTFWPEVPGVIPGTIAFSESVFRAHPSAPTFFDVFAYHPYRYPFLAPEAAGLPLLPGQARFSETIDQVRALLGRHGAASKPVWITEVGWHTARRALPFAGVSEQEQARYLVRSAVAALARGVSLFVWYELRDAGPLVDAYQEDAFGLLAWDPDPLDSVPARRKPAFAAQRTLATRLAGTHFDRDVRRDLSLPSEAHAYRFSGAGGKLVTVLWSTTGPLPGPRARIGVPAGKAAQVWALDGTTLPAQVVGGALEVTLSEDPLFVEVR